MLFACGVLIPGFHPTNLSNAHEYLELVKIYGQKYMFGNQGNKEHFITQNKSEVKETLRVIGLKLGMHKSDSRLPPWDYIRSTASNQNRGIQRQLSRAEEWIIATIQRWVENAKTKRVPRGSASPGRVRSAFTNLLEAGYTIMETDKNLGMVAVKQELAMQLYENYTADKRVLGRAEEVKTKQLQRLEEERLAMLTYIRVAAAKTSNEWLAEAVKTIERGMLRESTLPRLRLLIKLHKIKKSGAIPTRPIVPAAVAPAGVIGMIAGKVLGNVQTAIPWVCKSTEHFIEWLTDTYRGEVKTYDFTNLFGNENVVDTIAHLGWSIRFRPKWYENSKQPMVTKPFLETMQIPSWISWAFPMRSSATLLEIMVAYVIRETIFLAPTKEGPKVFITTECLAMGAAPVCPVSNIVLAVMEARKHGDDVCEQAIRRFVDDVAMDGNLLHDRELRSAYPSYLTLNETEEGSFLDLNFRQWRGKKCTRHVVYWPHLKTPIPSLPHYTTAHRAATKRAMLHNELSRIARRCSHREFYPHFRDVVLKRFRKAAYPDKMLRQYEDYSWEQAKAVRSKERVKPNQADVINHVARMYWDPLPMAGEIKKLFPQYDIRTAWKANVRMSHLPRKFWSYMAGEHRNPEYDRMFASKREAVVVPEAEGEQN